MSFPIVGSHFRPPAKPLLQVLPGGCPLTLRPEPGNQYDPNAIAVWVKSDDIPESAGEDLDLLAAPFGYSLEDILDEPEWQLGYIPAKIAKDVKLPPGDTRAELVFGAAGSPMVRQIREEPRGRDAGVGRESEVE